ncbi:hypothetical protein J4Q44_G00303300 [Coregonus suidteri]|uniref:Uncharacterized protein n=1 Tax=Coregonus suidteri TaxID=861788 RepID=A0AAN8QBJ2_9TELE
MCDDIGFEISAGPVVVAQARYMARDLHLDWFSCCHLLPYASAIDSRRNDLASLISVVNYGFFVARCKIILEVVSPAVMLVA